ncbi:MAG: hypothetical protein DMF04_10065 [Verrucomicrobia bacterium]|nr:MAG: hypothetical protein DMF04_10065 [Verrucomicrobiota bacterium]
MDWLQKNYERVLLIATVAVLLLSAFCIFRNAVGFQSQFTELQSHPIQRPASPPGKANEVNASLEKLRQPPQWTFAGPPGLFVPEKHFIGADGQPATLKTTEVHPPVPNDWIEQFGLPIADADVLEQDPDGDGFNNFDEWQGHTNPIDGKSHPNYLTKLKLKSFSQEPFRLVFASRTEGTFGINNIDLNQPTQFVKIGDIIAGTHFRVGKFTEKWTKDRYGTDVDVSELTLENTETHEQLSLVKEKVAISPESVASFVYSWRDRREFVVKKDQEFSLPPQGDIRYKLLDVQPTKAVIVSSQKPDVPIEIGLISQ